MGVPQANMLGSLMDVGFFAITRGSQAKTNEFDTQSFQGVAYVSYRM